MYFSIAAPQSVTVPTPAGPVTIEFRVNPADSSLVEIHVKGASPDGIDGTHTLTFKRNGTASDQTFTPVERPAGAPLPVGKQLSEDIPGTPVPVPPVPYASVNDGAVRGTDPQWDQKSQTASAKSQVDKDNASKSMDAKQPA